MIAKKAKVKNLGIKNLGICGKCGKRKDLTQRTKADGKICEDCYLEKFQVEIPVDEYSLQPDEMTKEQFAEKAGVGLRAVEIWKKNGKIQSQKLRRRVDGVVRQQLIFKTGDVENFLNGANEAVNLPKIEKTNNTEQTETAMTSPPFVFDFMNAMNQFAQMMQPRKSGLTELTGKLFIDIDELAIVSGIAKSRLDTAIKEAQAKETLRHFTGERGRSVYRCDELDLLLENLPPTPRQLPPKRKRQEK